MVGAGVTGGEGGGTIAREGVGGAGVAMTVTAGTMAGGVGGGMTVLGGGGTMAVEAVVAAAAGRRT